MVCAFLTLLMPLSVVASEDPPAPLPEVRSLVAAGQNAEAAARLIEAADRWIRAGRYGEAERLLEAGTALLPGDTRDPRLAHLLGRSRALEGRFEAAEEPLLEALAAGFRDPSTLLLAGSVLWENSDGDRARALFAEAVSTGGGAVARHQLGRLEIWLGRPAEAVVQLEAAAADASVGLDVLLDLAQAYERSGRFDEARGAFTRFLSAYPESSNGHYGLGLVLRSLGESEQAARHFARYAELMRRHTESVRSDGLLQAELNRASFLVADGRAGEALDSLAPLADSPAVLAARARAHRAIGDLQAAITALESAVALAPERADLRAQLREIYLARQAAGGDG